tara:strand:+ start:528 stop:848 length:321 start_codon:yes stop_codon:yes gene_type:complete
MHSNLNSKEVIIQGLKDEFKNKNVQVETIFYTDSTYILNNFSSNIYYYGVLTIGENVPEVHFSFLDKPSFTPDANSQHDIIFQKLTFLLNGRACQFYGYKFILTDK